MVIDQKLKLTSATKKERNIVALCKKKKLTEKIKTSQSEILAYFVGPGIILGSCMYMYMYREKK